MPAFRGISYKQTLIHDESDSHFHLQDLFKKGEVYDASDVAPIPKREPLVPEQIPNLEAEYQQIADDEEEIAMKRRQDWYNDMLRSGQMKLVTAEDEDDSEEEEEVGKLHTQLGSHMRIST